MKTIEDSRGFDVVRSFKCPGSSLCSTCFWSISNGGYCNGCDEDYQQQCVKRICYFACSTCSGGRHAQTQGCCNRMPASRLEYWKEILECTIPDFAPEPIQISCRLIPIIHSVRKYRIPEQFPQIDAWAIPIHKVANRKGKFRSNDLKDYLGLPLDRKLILSTYAPDDYQEMLWEKGPEMDFQRYSIDYWFPGHFSIYLDDSKLYQFSSAKRQQIHAIRTKSQFVWFQLHEHIPLEFQLPIRMAPSVLLSAGMMYSARTRAILKKEAEIADRWFPINTSFFVIGRSKHLPIASDRNCFEINSTWLMRGLRGHNLTRQLEEGIPKKQVLINNLKEMLENEYPTRE